MDTDGSIVSTNNAANDSNFSSAAPDFQSPDGNGIPLPKKPQRVKFVRLLNSIAGTQKRVEHQGRIECSCQARRHKLIGNCLHCGRIVCDQEGAGPCLYCGEIVTANDQQTTREVQGPTGIPDLTPMQSSPISNCPSRLVSNFLSDQQQAAISMTAPPILQGQLRMSPKDPFAMMDRHRLDWQEGFLRDLEAVFRKTWSDVRLHLFGSSCNGFGLQRSDLDICLTFAGWDGAPNWFESQRILSHVACILDEMSDEFENVDAVMSAKVPIVKFVHIPSKLEGDISVYNTLALRNTKLLRAYAEVDPRVAQLGHMLKVFAKTFCDFGTEKWRCLPSYAYILKMIFYLQRTDPPVVPCLQALFRPGTGPEDIPESNFVEGWNTYFYDDLKNLGRIWPHFGKNRQSVAELWLGFLRFYTEQFDVNEHVICIRQLEPLTKLEKNWIDRLISIEDPFELSHNLGCRLDGIRADGILNAYWEALFAASQPPDQQIVAQPDATVIPPLVSSANYFNQQLRFY